MATTSRSADLTSGPMLQKIILFSVPLAASSILQLLFNAADVVVVGRFAGSTALAAVGSNGALINLLVNLFVGLSLGANVVAARCFGARDEKGVQDTVHTAVALGLVSGVLLAVVGFCAARGLLELMSCPEDVISLSTLYLKIYFIGMPMTMLYNFSSALLRAMGDTKRPLYCLAAAGVINGCWIMSSVQAAADQSGKWAIVNMPKLDGIDGATNYANCGGASWAVSSNCKNTELAFDFLKSTFGSSVELYDDLLPNAGAISSYLPAAESDVYNQPSEFYGGQTVYKDIVEFAGKVPAFDCGAYYSDVRSALTDAVTNIVQNNADIDSEMQNAQDTVEFNIAG
jgi:hypothetical protein